MILKTRVRVATWLLAYVFCGPFFAEAAKAQDDDLTCENRITIEDCTGKGDAYYGHMDFYKCTWNEAFLKCEQGLPTAKSMKKFQQALQEKGFRNLKPTGKLDDQTVDALKKFQTQKGLTASGKLDQKTIDALRQ